MGSCSSKDIIFPRQNQPFEEIRFLQSAKTRMDEYFHRLYDNIKVSLTREEIVHVRDGVEGLVLSILQVVGSLDPRFVMEEKSLIKVGSFYEGTKLGRLDQFDYMATIPALKYELFEVDVLNDNPNDINVSLYIDDLANEVFVKDWKGMILDTSYLVSKKTKENKTKGILDVFLKRVKKAVHFLNVKETKFGRLEVEKTSPCVEGSSIQLSFIFTREWFEIEDMRRIDKTSSEVITVNIMPAIKSTKVQDFVSSKDCFNEAVYNEVIKTGSVMLIAADDGHFMKAFSETETRLVQNLLQRHLKAFCVIKYLFHGIDKRVYPSTFRGLHYKLFESFALKMIMITAAEVCPCKEYTEFELFDCVMFILLRILQSLYEDCDAVYTIYQNVFIKTNTSSTSDSQTVQLHQVALTELIKHDLKYWIGEREKYDFSKIPKHYGVTPLNVKMHDMLQKLNP